MRILSVISLGLVFSVVSFASVELEPVRNTEMTVPVSQLVVSMGAKTKEVSIRSGMGFRHDQEARVARISIPVKITLKGIETSYHSAFTVEEVSSPQNEVGYYPMNATEEAHLSALLDRKISAFNEMMEQARVNNLSKSFRIVMGSRGVQISLIPTP